MASVADPRTVGTRTAGWAGGMNIRDAVTQLGPDEARNIENMVLDERGGATKRLGVEYRLGDFGAEDHRPISMYTFYNADDPPQLLMHTADGTLYFTNDPDGTPVDWHVIKTGVGNTPLSFETFNNKVYFGNGVDNYASWDGSTYTAFPSAPKGRWVRLWRDTMWISGITGTLDRVYASDAGNAEVFGIASWVDIAKGDGDQVMGLWGDPTYLVVFKRRKIATIYDPATFANRTVDYERGSESHFTIVPFDGQLYFLSRDGICRFLPDQPSIIISSKVEPLFRPDVLNFAATQHSMAYSTGVAIGWGLPEGTNTVPTMQLEYYPRLGPLSAFGTRGVGPFTIHRMPVSCYSRFRSASSDKLYGGSNDTNRFFQVFAGGLDDHEPFQATLESGPIDLGAPTLTKYLRRMWLLGRGAFTMRITKDFGAGGQTYVLDIGQATDVWDITEKWGVGVWGSAPGAGHEKLVNPDIYARYFTFTFTDLDPAAGKRELAVGSVDYRLTSGEWALYALVLEGYLLGRRF